MSGQIRWTFRPRGRSDDEESSQLVGPVVQPSDEQPQQEEPPTESQDITPGQEKEGEGALVVQGLALEANQQKLAQPKTGRECGDGPDVKGKRL
ncbi:PREDICTED: G antigen 10 [Ceratotherium simum simum]|uniref:G antigen 10 n=1 Tax=Ceratotherium simum simum TaxID=73337 RepID=A0ABM1D3R4_CERSS|nr:PREDICTED: G antigen 10 [Ceratotherium simum simum]